MKDKDKIAMLRAALIAFCEAETEEDLRGFEIYLSTLPDSDNKKVALQGINALIATLP